MPNQSSCIISVLNKLVALSGKYPRASYGPFAEYICSHSTKTPCWMAYNTLGQELQRERVTSFKSYYPFFQGPKALFIFHLGVFGTISIYSAKDPLCIHSWEK